MRALILTCLIAVVAAGDAPAPQAPAVPSAIEIQTTLGTIRCRLFANECPETVATFCALAEGTRAWTDPATGAQVQKPFYDGLAFHRVIPGFMIQGGCPLGSGTGGPGFQFKDEINAVSLGLDQERALQGDQLHPQCGYMGGQFVQLYIQPKLEAQGIGPTTPENERNAAIAALLPGLANITLARFYTDLGYRYDPALPASHKPQRGSLAMANSGPNTNGSQFFINLGDTPHLTGKHTVFGEVTDGLAVAEAIGAVPRDARDKPKAPVVITRITVLR